jgi:DNA-binding MarR family transcriptional regulator
MSDEGNASEPRFVYLIGRVDRGLRAVMEEALRELDLSIPEYTAMSVLERRPGLSNAQLARRSLIAPQSMIHVIARLEERGLVGRDTDPSHGRILRAKLTGRGKKLLAKAHGRIEVVEDDLLAGLSESRRELVRDALGSVVARLRDSR